MNLQERLVQDSIVNEKHDIKLIIPLRKIRTGEK